MIWLMTYENTQARIGLRWISILSSSWTSVVESTAQESFTSMNVIWLEVSSSFPTQTNRTLKDEETSLLLASLTFSVKNVKKFFYCL